MQRLLLKLICLITLATPLCQAASADSSDTFQWSNVSRVVVVPDVHGAWSALIELLQMTNIINAELQWTGGNAHLVSLGDLLDRGPRSRDVMDLLMRLQAEALAAGGQVHVVAGNHELMNLIGDLRYVAKEEYAAFAKDETAAMRGERVEVSARYPAGFFAHRQAFSAQGKYGRWLLTLPAVITINGVAYAHGGLPPIATTMSLDMLNSGYRAAVSSYLSQWQQLLIDGVLPDDQHADVEKLAQAALKNAQLSPCLVERTESCATTQQTEQLQQFIEISRSPLLNDAGPLWYRGAVYCRALFERPILESALANIGATRLVVGHTTTPDAQVHSLHADQMTLLDTGMLVSYYKGRPAALVMEAGKDYVQFLNPAQQGQPVKNSYPGAYGLSSSELLRAAKIGKIEVLDKSGDSQSWSVQLSYNAKILQARFKPIDSDLAAEHEIAAFRLNQILGFELVAPTVMRDIEGTRGALQIIYDQGMTEQQRQVKGAQASGWCSINRQLQLMYAWDLLTLNKGRSTDTIYYQTPLWRIQLDGHQEAFGDSKRLPRGLKKEALDIHPSVLEALKLLSRDELQRELGEVLDKKSINALLSRRDALLKLFR